MAKTINSGKSAIPAKTVAKAKTGDAPPAKGKKVSPAQYIRNIRAEMGKVTWPSKKETTSTTMVVLLMVFIASLFFLLVDQIFYRVISWLLGLSV